MGMHQRLVVTTTCPSCGAPVDFNEGSNAVRCDYCRSNLLVTGHKQVLSYFIAPKLEPERASEAARSAYRETGASCQVLNVHLYFVPYYRLTGHDFRWEHTNPSPKPHGLERLCGDYSEWRHGLDDRPRLEFRERYVEKNFIARQVRGLYAHSLGVRPAVLRLNLFRREYLASLGTIVAADLSPKEALARGMKTVDRGRLVYRQVLGRMLSVIYFPYWVMEVQRRQGIGLSVVDAVSYKVIESDAPVTWLTDLQRQASGSATVVGFRPLVCPNCGWDLPYRPDDVIFFCSACDRAWQISGSDLRRVAYEVADLPQITPQTAVTYLPFWVLRPNHKSATDRRFILPAFRYRRLKILADLGTRLTRKQPTYAVLSGPKPEMHGGYYDKHDALKLAGATYVGLTAARSRNLRDVAGQRLVFSSATLTWFPFRHQGRALVDPFTGLHVPQQGLI